jgi:hypothetical protein
VILRVEHVLQFRKRLDTILQSLLGTRFVFRTEAQRLAGVALLQPEVLAVGDSKGFCEFAGVCDYILDLHRNRLCPFSGIWPRLNLCDFEECSHDSGTATRQRRAGRTGRALRGKRFATFLGRRIIWSLQCKIAACYRPANWQKYQSNQIGFQFPISPISWGLSLVGDMQLSQVVVFHPHAVIPVASLSAAVFSLCPMLKVLPVFTCAALL